MKVGDLMHLTLPVRDSSGKIHPRGEPVRIERIIEHDGAGDHKLVLVLPMVAAFGSRFYCYENELEACTCEAGDAS